MLNSQYIQLLKSDAHVPPPKTKVTVHHYLDDSLRMRWSYNELKYEIFNSKPKSSKSSHITTKLSINHPLRKLNHKIYDKNNRQSIKFDRIT